MIFISCHLSKALQVLLEVDALEHCRGKVSLLCIPPGTGWLKQEESKVPAECKQPEEDWKGEREGIPREGNSHRKIPVSKLNLSST